MGLITIPLYTDPYVLEDSCVEVSSCFSQIFFSFSFFASSTMSIKAFSSWTWLNVRVSLNFSASLIKFNSFVLLESIDFTRSDDSSIILVVSFSNLCFSSEVNSNPQNLLSRSAISFAILWASMRPPLSFPVIRV